MAEVRIIAETRTEFGKGAARRTRRDRKVPAVIYGHGGEPRHVSLPAHDLMLALKTPNVLLSLDLAGETLLVLPRDVQRDPVKDIIEHADLVLVVSGETVTVDVPITPVGEIAPGGVLVTDTNTISVETEATHVPTSVEISVQGLEPGAQLHASDLALPEGTSLAGDPELMILHVVAQQSALQAEAELATAEAEAGIVHEEKTAAPAV